MSKQLENYEDISSFYLDEAQQQQLLEAQTECVFMWTNKEGEPIGVVMSYFADGGRIWLTSAEQRKRVPALRRDPRCCVCINSSGSRLGGGWAVTYKGIATLHKGNQKLNTWFYRRLAEKLYGHVGPETVQSFVDFLDTPARVLIEVTPTKTIGFDGQKMAKATPWLGSGWKAK